MKFIDKFRKFMYGRYGIDDLYKFLFGFYIFLVIIDLFIKNYVISIIELLVLIILVFRSFSKNITKRKKENKFFLKIKNKIINPFKNIKKRVKDKTYVYKKCPKCKNTLRLKIPSKKGIKTINCPKCKKRFKRLVLKKEKIEYIKKKDVK